MAWFEYACHPSQWKGLKSNGQRIHAALAAGKLWIGHVPEYRPDALTLLLVARYAGEHRDDRNLRHQTPRRLTEGAVDWP